MVLFNWGCSRLINKLSLIRSLNLFVSEARISKWSKSIEQLHSSRWSDTADCLTHLRRFPGFVFNHLLDYPDVWLKFNTIIYDKFKNIFSFVANMLFLQWEMKISSYAGVWYKNVYKLIFCFQFCYYRLVALS